MITDCPHYKEEDVNMLEDLNLLLPEKIVEIYLECPECHWRLLADIDFNDFIQNPPIDKL